MPKRHPLIGKRLLSVGLLPRLDLSALGWDGRVAVLTFSDAKRRSLIRVVASQDPEQNGPGVIFGEDAEGAFYVFGRPDDHAMLGGRVVKDVRPMTDLELTRQAWVPAPWEPAPKVLVLDNGILFPSKDEEGNGPGAWLVLHGDRAELL